MKLLDKLPKNRGSISLPYGLRVFLWLVLPAIALGAALHHGPSFNENSVAFPVICGFVLGYILRSFRELPRQ